MWIHLPFYVGGNSDTPILVPGMTVMQVSLRCKRVSELGGPLDGNPTVEISGVFFVKFYKVVVERFKCQIFIYG
jgi:hypothetical protein